MSKGTKSKKTRPAVRGSAAPAYSAEALEVRALLRRVPDGFQAGLNSLAARPAAERERVMAELIRGMGKDVLTLLRTAALGANEDFAASALRVLPIFGTRAAGDVLVEAYHAQPEGERRRLAYDGAKALQALGIQVAVPEQEDRRAPEYTLRETYVTAPDGVGSRSIVARLQDEYGVWHAIFVLWNDQAGVKDGFMRPFSRQEWTERVERMLGRASAPVLCPPDYARWQVEQGRRLNAETGFPLEDHLKDWDLVMGSPADDYAPPDPLELLPALGDEDRAARLHHSPELFSLPAVRSWFLEAEDCVEKVRPWSDLQARIRLRGESDELVAEVAAVVTEATTALLPAVLLSLYRARLLDLSRALVFQHLPLQAERAASVVEALDRGVTPTEIPFFTGLVERSFIATAELMARGENLARMRYRPMRKTQR